MNKIILLVEDEAILALMTKRWLLNEGFEVVQALTGEDALSIASDHLQPIDLVLMDVDLGSGIDGTQTASEILKIRNLPILFLSSHTEKEVVEKTEKITSYGYVVKGSGNTVLLASIKMAFKLFDAHKTISQREEALVKSEKKYRLLFENMTSGFAYFEVLHDKDEKPYELRLLDVNPAFEKLSGFNLAYLKNKTLAGAKADIEKNWFEKYLQMTTSPQPYIVQEYSQKRDKYFEIMLFSPEKNYLAMIFNDITERKRNEGKLIDSFSTLEYFIKHARSAIAIHDKELKYLYVSDQYLRDYNVKDKNIIGKHHYEVFPDLPEKWRKVHQMALQGIVSSEENDIYQRADGTVEWTRWECRPWYDINGEIGGIIVYTEVITEKKIIEDKLRESELKFSSAFNYSSTGIALISLSGKFISLNNTIKRMFEYSDVELLNLTIMDITYPEDLNITDEIIQRLIKGEIDSYQIEKRFMSKSGKVFWGEFEISLVRSESNEPQFFVCHLQDITLRKEAEIQIALYNEKLRIANQDKERFISILAHDLKGPISGFIGLSEELANNSDILMKEEIAELGNVMHDSAKSINSLIINLLDWSKLQMGGLEFKNESFDIFSESNCVISLFSHPVKEKFLTVINQIEPNTLVMADKYVFSTVLRNLISNAVKFSKAGGQIIVSSEQYDDLIEIKVSDTGVGISAEKIKKLFTIGSKVSTKGTNNESGSGLGLVLCHDLLKNYGGKIAIKSDPGTLTDVTFSFPNFSIREAS